MTTSLRYDDVRVGDELPVLDVPVTRSLIVATAIASRDCAKAYGLRVCGTTE